MSNPYLNWDQEQGHDIPPVPRIFDADGVPLWQCNDCGILIPDHMPLCDRCQREEDICVSTNNE